MSSTSTAPLEKTIGFRNGFGYWIVPESVYITPGSIVTQIMPDQVLMGFIGTANQNNALIYLEWIQATKTARIYGFPDPSTPHYWGLVAADLDAYYTALHPDENSFNSTVLPDQFGLPDGVSIQFKPPVRG